MRFVGGDLQGRYMARVGVWNQRCLVVPVDVGKWSVMALVADHHGELVVAPFKFMLEEPGVRCLLSAIGTARAGRNAAGVGVEPGAPLPPDVGGSAARRGDRSRRTEPGGGEGGTVPAAAAAAEGRRARPGAMAELMVRGGRGCLRRAAQGRCPCGLVEPGAGASGLGVSRPRRMLLVDLAHQGGHGDRPKPG